MSKMGRPTNASVRALVTLLNTPTDTLGGKSPREQALVNVDLMLLERDGAVLTDNARWATARVLEYTDGPPAEHAKQAQALTQVNVTVQYDSPAPGHTQWTESATPSTFLSAAPPHTQIGRAHV
jgi:hypothetical protein